ncbi:MAG: amidohydrolase [Chloroflexi bacterium]|nr:amidohydrolase [Chloroflexota bacterium]
MGQPARGRIDVHHHVLPPQFSARTPSPVPFPEIEARLEGMDGLGIQVAMTSLTPRVFLGYPDDPRGVARACNEYQAGLMEQAPGRFGAFAVLPLPDVDGALGEVAYALDVLRLDGVGLFSSTGHRYPGHPELDPLLEELHRRRAAVFIHPAHCTTPPEWGINAFDGIIEYGFDTTRCIVNLVQSGAFERYPGIRFIFSHGGGAAPYLARRIESHYSGATALLQAQYYDNASLMGAHALRTLQAFVPADQILWGTDIPFIHGDRLGGQIAEWEAYDGLSAAEREGVEFGNARTLFPRLGAPVG